MAEEEPLSGGIVSGAVVRVGATVRKPWTPATPSVHHLLGYLAERGFDGSPKVLGQDDQGRQILEYIAGDVAHDVPALDVDGLARVGSLLRRLHDLTQTYTPPSSARWNVALHPNREDLVCHNDLAPWNLVLGANRWVLIDWDNAGPASREPALEGTAPKPAGGAESHHSLIAVVGQGVERTAGTHRHLDGMLGSADQ